MATIIPENLRREQYVFLAQRAQVAGRYEEMALAMQKLVLGATSDLTVEERNLLSVAYKTAIDSLRGFCRIISSGRMNKDDAVLVKKFETRLSQLRFSIISLLDSHLIMSAQSNDSLVFFLKMKGDFLRDLVKSEIGDDRKRAADEAVDSYQTAQNIAAANLVPTHPLRLELAFNFSVFYAEILNERDKACRIAMQAFDQVLSELTIGLDSSKDVALYLGLFMDQLSEWTSDGQIPSPIMGPTVDKLSRELYVYLAKVAKRAKCYEEMLQFMEKLILRVTPEDELTVEERELFFVAYEKAIGIHLRALISFSDEQAMEVRTDENRLVRGCKSKPQLFQACTSIVRLIESHLIPSARSSDSQIFYLKMKGDFLRDLVMFKIRDEMKTTTQEVVDSYQKAQLIAADLAPIHPLRLELAFNFSVFCYEILNRFDDALTIAVLAYLQAEAELDTLGEESYKDSTLIMQHLKGNILLWTSSVEDQLEES